MQTACPLLRKRPDSDSGMSCASSTGSVSGRFIVMYQMSESRFAAFDRKGKMILVE